MQVQGKHMSPLHSGQEDKRGKKGWDRYLEEKKEEEGGGGGFLKKEKTRKKTVSKMSGGSTVVHKQENRDSFFFGLWTDKSTHQSRSQDLESESDRLYVPSPRQRNNPGIPCS